MLNFGCGGNMGFLDGYARKLGVMEYLGVWNASTNTPTLASSSGQKGGYYIVSVGGNTLLDGISDWGPSDWLVFNGETWEKIDNSERVTSVNGQTGAVVIDSVNELDGGEAHTIYGGNGIFSGGSA